VIPGSKRRRCHCRLSAWLWNGRQRKLRFTWRGDVLHVELKSLDMRLPKAIIGCAALRARLRCLHAGWTPCHLWECPLHLLCPAVTHASVPGMQTRKLEALAIDIVELQLTLPWRPPPKKGARMVVLTSGVNAKLRYDTAGSAGPRSVHMRLQHCGFCSCL
jgi:hypothetical protein